MTVIAFPAAAALQIAGWSLAQQRFDITEQSASTGHTASRLGAPPRWRLTMRSVPALLAAEAARWKATALQLRGRIHHLAAWDITLPAPRGSARGTLVTSGTTALGASSVVINGATHKNLYLAAQAFDNAAWSKVGGAVTANAVAAPDGTSTADTLVEDGAAGGHYLTQAIPFTSGLAYTLSCHFKVGAGTRYANLVLPSAAFGSNKGIVVNVATGAIVTNAGSVTAVVTDAGGGWWRAECTATATATVSGSPQLRMTSTTSFASSYTGDSTSSLHFWGAQCEQASASTAYAGFATLLAGDWLQIGTGVGSHYCMVLADVSASDAGVLTVSIEPPTRASIANGTAVAWDKPVAHYKLVPDSIGWDGVPGSSDVGGFAFDLLEDWSA